MFQLFGNDLVGGEEGLGGAAFALGERGPFIEAISQREGMPDCAPGPTRSRLGFHETRAE
jgi:hypothetical protein